MGVTTSIYIVVIAIITILTIAAIWVLTNSKDSSLHFSYLLNSLFISILTSVTSRLLSDIFFMVFNKGKQRKSIDIQNLQFYLSSFFNLNHILFEMVFTSHILVIAFHRLYAVMFPITFRSQRVVKKAKKIVLAFWVIDIFLMPMSLVDLFTKGKHNIRFYTEYTSCIVNLVVSLVVIFIYMYIILKIIRRNQDLKRTLRNKNSGANYRTIIFCMLTGFVFLASFFPLSVDFLFFKARYYYQGTVYIHLICFGVDPSCFLIKVWLERKCCVNDDKRPSTQPIQSSEERSRKLSFL